MKGSVCPLFSCISLTKSDGSEASAAADGRPPSRPGLACAGPKDGAHQLERNGPRVKNSKKEG